MTLPVRFHVVIRVTDATDDLRLAKLLPKVRHVEDLGFDGLTLGSHFTDWNGPSREWAWIWALIAQHTSQIRLLASMTAVPLLDPVAVAREALALNELSGGRVELALGVGRLLFDQPHDGSQPLLNPDEESGRFEEYVQLLAGLLRGQITEFSGRFYTVEDGQVVPRPHDGRTVPLNLPGYGWSETRVAISWADGWFDCSFRDGIDQQIAQVREWSAQLDQYFASSGRDRSSLRRGFLVAEDLRDHIWGGDVTRSLTVQNFTSWAEELVRLGYTDIGVYYPYWDGQLTTFEHIAREVLPELRGYRENGVPERGK
jgi:alkanesulfonate monooxygenase SsuD/methylene tetrahydromethanopterin reductase-like flavin-dependent oxidoreductase (luciferase family)